VLLMDEPLANLDPPHQTDWMRRARLVAQGTTVVSVLHELSFALLADEMVVMAAGQVVHHGACQAPPPTRRWKPCSTTASALPGGRPVDGAAALMDAPIFNLHCPQCP
jgi:energy-coupling factor transporter ATP-binding protein EcfA2